MSGVIAPSADDTVTPDTPAEAARFGRFCEHYCGISLEPFQRRVVAELFAHRELLVLVPRGNGKTSLAAALALYHLLTTPQPAVYVAAAGRDQARLTFEIARRMVGAHPELDRHVRPRWNELRAGEGFLRVLSSDAPRAHGLGPTLAIVDELHAHRSPDLYVALKTALGKRPGARLLTISTAGYDVESVLGKLRARALSLPGLERDGTLTAAHDPQASFAMLEWACPPGADLSDPAAVKAANPASFVTEGFLAEQIASPGLHPLEFARYHAGTWTESADLWLPHGAWEACAGEVVFDPGERVYLGVDIGGERAASAIVGVTADLRVGVVEVFQGEGAVLEVARAVRRLAGTYDVAEVAYDPWRFQAPALELAEEGLRMVEFPQSNSRMVQAAERLYAAVVERRLVHPDDPDLNRHVRTAVARETPRGWRLDKAKTRQQIDAVVALAMAVERAEAPKPAPTELLGWI